METELKSDLASRNRIWDAFPIHVPASAATFAGFRARATSDEFPEPLRASFINKELVIDMSPEELESHNKVKSELSAVVATLIKRLDTGEFYGDGTLVTNEAAELSTEPDATFVAWESFKRTRFDSWNGKIDRTSSSSWSGRRTGSLRWSAVPA